MKFTLQREDLFKPLQMVAGVVERRQTLPVLANVLMVLQDDSLSLTGTDLEVEITARTQVEPGSEAGEITVPARKLFDIVRSLPDGAGIEIVEENQRVIVKSGRSRFTLSTLPANEFPSVEESATSLNFELPGKDLHHLIHCTAFAMAQQDVRYYLNGMLWEINNDSLRLVATDGHRLALCTRQQTIDTANSVQAILPRKGVVELSRLVNDLADDIAISVGTNHLRINADNFTFTSKLVDGKFPDYERVLPRGGDKLVFGNRAELKAAFNRTAILSNEKYRGVRFGLSEGLLTIQANNPEQEEAVEEVTVDYTGSELEIGFNVSYLLDVLNVLESEAVKITLADSNSSALLEEPEGGDSVYVVMPMRL